MMSLSYLPYQDEATSIDEVTLDVRPSRTRSFPSQTQVTWVLHPHQRPSHCHLERVFQVQSQPSLHWPAGQLIVNPPRG